MFHRPEVSRNLSRNLLWVTVLESTDGSRMSSENINIKLAKG